MAAKNDNIIKGKTQTGIKFALDKRIKDDSRLLLYLTRMENKSKSDMERGQALMSLMELMFGSGEGLETFFNEVAAKHNGIADKESLMTELSDIFEALEVKN